MKVILLIFIQISVRIGIFTQMQFLTETAKGRKGFNQSCFWHVEEGNWDVNWKIGIINSGAAKWSLESCKEQKTTFSIKNS